MTGNYVAIFGLIGAAIGVIPGLLGVVMPWLRSRDAVATATRSLELAKQEVEFIDAWFKAMAEVCEEPDRAALKAQARERLHALFGAGTQAPLATGLLPAADETAAAEQGPEAGDDATQQRAPRKIGMFSYVYLGFFCFMLFGASIDTNNEVSLSYFIQELHGDGGIAVAVFAIPVLFILYRFWNYKRLNKQIVGKGR